MHEDLAGTAQGATDDLADIVPRGVGDDGAGFELGHVEQVGDEAVEPLGFVDHGGEQIVLLRFRQGGAEIAQRAGGAEHRGQRRLQIMRDRGQKRAAQPVGFHRALDAVHVLDQQHPLDRERALIDQRIQQAALVRRQQRAGPVVIDADDADRAAPGPHRQEQPLGTRQRIRAAPGRTVVVPGPVGGSEIGLIELVFRRIATLDRQHAFFRQQQHHADLEHQRGLVGGRPQHVVQRRGAGQLAAEGIERFSGAYPADRGIGLRPHTRRNIGDQQRNQHEEKERCDVGGIGDGEGIDRRQEEEVVAQRRRDARQHRRPQPKARGNGDDGGEENQIDVLDSPKQRPDQFGGAKADRDEQQRHQIGPRIESFLPRCGLHRRLGHRMPFELRENSLGPMRIRVGQREQGRHEEPAQHVHRGVDVLGRIARLGHGHALAPPRHPIDDRLDEDALLLRFHPEGGLKRRQQRQPHHPQPIRLKMPGWGGSAAMRMENGSEPQPWHCPPFVDGSAYGIELIYHYETECHIVNEDIGEPDRRRGSPATHSHSTCRRFLRGCRIRC